MKTLATAAALTGLIAALSTGAFAEDSIKVGVLVGYSGISSLSGQQTDAAIKLFQKKYGEAPGGKKIELIRRDTTGPNPEVAKRLVQEAVTRDKARILIGPDFTPNTLAAAPIVTEAKVPTMVMRAARRQRLRIEGIGRQDSGRRRHYGRDLRRRGRRCGTRHDHHGDLFDPARLGDEQ